MRNEETHQGRDDANESRGYYQGLFQWSPVAFARLDGQGRVLELNHSARRLLGPTAKATEVHLAGFVVDADRGVFEDHLRQATLGGAVCRCELHLRDTTTSPLVVQMHTVFLESVRAGRGFLCALVDTTVQSEFQAEIWRLNQELEARVDQRTRELQEQTLRLEETNTALRIMIDYNAQEREALGESVLANVARLVRPLVDRLRGAETPGDREAILAALESSLGHVTSGFTTKLTSQKYQLSPRELEVAGLIRDGKTSDQIAELLFISTSSVLFHRNNIRHKLGLKGSKVRLATYLGSLS